MDGLLNDLKTITMKHKGGLLSFGGNSQPREAFPAIKSSVPETSIEEVALAHSDEAQKNGSDYQAVDGEPGTSANSSSCNSVKQKATVQNELQRSKSMR